jgi:predicted DCC family thiol-disulfide oxidoreductase YuxK
MTEVKFEHPVLIFDADCGFCTRAVDVIRHKLPTSADVKSFQVADLASYGTDEDRASHELLWVGRSGRIDGGAQAIARLLLDSGGFYAIPGLLLRIPPMRWIAHGVYRLIANNRQRMPGGTPACAMPTAKVAVH